MVWPIWAIASTMLRSIRSCATLCMNCPSILRKSTGRFFRKMKDERPLPKSSSENRQPRSRSSLHEVLRAGEAAHGRRLGHLEAQRAGAQVGRGHLGEHEVEELLVVERRGGHVDRKHEGGRAAGVAAPVRVAGARLAHDPAIERGHQIEAFRGGDEFRGLHQLPVLVLHAQQQLEVSQLLDAGADRHDRLADEQQPVLLAGAIDARHPLHLAVTLGRAALAVGLHPVAARSPWPNSRRRPRRSSPPRATRNAPLISASPIDTPTFITRSCQTKRKSRIACRRFSAIRCAVSSVQSCSSTPNSSPPSRASVSVVRMRVCTTLVSCFRSRSPAWCPQVSLTTLNWSRSR